MRELLRVPAIEVRQGRRTLYMAAVEGKRLHEFAAVSRVRRTDGLIAGYQRPEVIAHIRSIRAYLESEDALMPNALVVCFDERVRFEAGPAPFGQLTIPLLRDADDADKPGWLVDGQQRAAAVRDADIAGFPLPFVAFITGDVREQRAQFVLVNNTKPLPKGLVYELLPSTDAPLPVALARKRYPARLLDRLNFDPRSPMYGTIRTPTAPGGVIKDNSVLRMLEASLSDGVLYRYRDASTGEGDIGAMLSVLHAFWAAVRDVFCDAWGLAPARSRLMHGAGIASLGFLMDTIASAQDAPALPDRLYFLNELTPLAADCAWRAGQWKFASGQRRAWNEIQNTPTDIRLLSDHLQHLHLHRRTRASAAA